MTGELSIHDNHVLSYTVDCQEWRITLRTVDPYSKPPKHTDIVFSGVVAHHFERGDMVTILFDIKEVSPEQVYGEYGDMFERNKGEGWPEERRNTETMKGFLISSSYGLEGFVLAHEMRLVASH
jgi:hypothetical protein